MSLRHSTQPKDVAAWALRELNVSTPYVLDFEQNDRVYLFYYDDVQYIAPGSELADKIRLIETTRHLKVYAVTHDFLLPIGEMYSFLCISKFEEDWDKMVSLVGENTFRVYAYVHNVIAPECSESGYIILRSEHGKLVRVG